MIPENVENINLEYTEKVLSIKKRKITKVMNILYPENEEKVFL